MFNLLPEPAKNEIRGEYKKRLAAAWLVVGIVTEVAFIIFLIPSWVSLLISERSLQVEVSSPTDASIGDTAALKEANADLLSISLASSSLAHVLGGLIADLGSSITLSDITYQNTTATTSNIHIEGRAMNRNVLTALADRLNQDPLFANVVLPVSSFAKNSNLEFSLSMTVFLATSTTSYP